MIFVFSRHLSSSPARRWHWMYRLALASLPAATVLAILCLEPGLAFGQKNQQHPSEKSSGGECHTPRDSEGNPDRSRWLQGSSLPFAPSKPDPDWPISAPRIGGNPPANDAAMGKLLTTGIWTTCGRLRFPMPRFRLEPKDAKTVVAYLKSVAARQ